MRPSILNAPLPRLKPQPIHITMMMRRRRDARQNRIDRSRVHSELNQDLLAERDFEARMIAKAGPKQLTESVYASRGWGKPVSARTVHRAAAEAIIDISQMTSWTLIERP